MDIKYTEPALEEIEAAKKAGSVYNPVRHKGEIKFWRLKPIHKKKDCGCGKKRT